MARRPTIPVRPERPHHTVEEKRQDIIRLQRRISALEAFDPSLLTKRFSNSEVTALEKSIETALESVFGHRTPEYDRYSAATTLDHGPVTMAGPWSRGVDEAANARRYLSEGKTDALALLGEAVKALEEEIEFAPPVSQIDIGEPTTNISRISKKVFVVHGHDEGAREAVARFVERLGFEAIILHEQANRGRTVIEKVEAHGDVGFAIVLLTPDDEGCVKGGVVEPRARQNVLLELGYFIGRLKRENVCALKRGQVEIPSDFAGVVWEIMDDTGGWKQALGRELQAAGHEIDWNQVMR